MGERMGLGKGGIQEEKNEKGREGLTGREEADGREVSLREMRWGIAWHRERKTYQGGSLGGWDRKK